MPFVNVLRINNLAIKLRKIVRVKKIIALNRGCS